jgi:chromosome transmission fidelity protein 1
MLVACGELTRVARSLFHFDSHFHFRAGDDTNSDVPDWMRNESERAQAEERMRLETRHAERLQKAKAKLSKSRNVFGADLGEAAQRHNAKSGAERKAVSAGDVPLRDYEQEFVLDEWDSEGEQSGCKRKTARQVVPSTPPCRLDVQSELAYPGAYPGIQGASSLSVMSSIDGQTINYCRPSCSSSDEDVTDDESMTEAPRKKQIYFCSRTHSQLSQFISELHRTPFASTLSVATIASRKVRPSQE